MTESRDAQSVLATHEDTKTPAHQDTQLPTHPNTFPTETEIYILPNGRVVVADLPSELSALVERVGAALEDLPAAPEDDEQPD